MKRSCIIVARFFVLILFASCTSRVVFMCDKCKEEKVTQNRLVGSVDMQLCDKCYAEYSIGQLGANN